MATNAPNAAGDPGFFDGHVLVEIDRWDATLHVGLSSEVTPLEYRFQGGLNYVRGFDIDGRVVAPKVHRSQAFRVWVSPFGPDARFGPDGLDEVGQVHSPSPEQPDFRATLLIPEAALATTATGLASVWKYLHIWTFDEDADRASVSAFSFSSTIHPNLDAWIAND